MQFITQDQPVTGDAKRTPRSEIVPVLEANILAEVRIAADGSDSESWGPPDRTFAVWPVQTDAIIDLVTAVEYVDSRMEAEQAAHAGQAPDDSADADEGGVMAAFFNDTYVPVGDLNKENAARKIAALRDPRDHHALPHGGTVVGGAVRYLDERFLKEFAKDEKTGLVVPVAKRPWILSGLFTDGAMADYEEFVYRLEMDRQKCAYLTELEDKYQGLWPGEHWWAAILGEGPEHDACVKLYTDISKTYTNVHVLDFSGVRNGHEIGEDVAVAMLNRK